MISDFFFLTDHSFDMGYLFSEHDILFLNVSINKTAFRCMKYRKIPVVYRINYRHNRVATKFNGQNSRIIQGRVKDIFVIFKDVKM